MCGKRRYLSRKDAKTVIRRIFPGEVRHYSAYQCDGYWHVGHVGATIKRGLMTRDERHH
jgi:hypothetical protein